MQRSLPSSGPYVTDELLHLSATQPCLLALPCQAVHQLLQILSVQDPVIVKVFGQKKVMFLWGPCDSSHKAPVLRGGWDNSWA